MNLSAKATWNSRLPQYAQALSNTLGPAVLQAADGMAATAKSLVRVDTESLKESIGTEELPGTNTRALAVVFAGDTSGGYKGKPDGRPQGAPVDYAIGQEYGPGTHTPYMTPASEVGWPEFIAILSTRIASLRV